MKFYFYRYKFLIFYIIIGIFSISIELALYRISLLYGLSIFYSQFFSFTVGLIVAFYLNIKFNFNVSKPKRLVALVYFGLISCFSLIIQSLFKKNLLVLDLNVYESRYLVSGLFFFISYLLHRKFTFKDYKKVGVAIYADGIDDVDKIYSKIGNICDFVHVDIVDKTFNPNSENVKAYKAEVIKAYWKNKKIEVHIMSKTPLKWIKEVIPFVDVIYIHLNISEDIDSLINYIKNNNCNPGLVLSAGEDFNMLNKHLHKVKDVMLLAIENPGYSGQKFDLRTLELVNLLNNHKKRNNFNLCVDGGVNKDTIRRLDVDAVVSGSYVLNATNSIKNIMLLQTSGDYEKY